MLFLAFTGTPRAGLRYCIATLVAVLACSGAVAAPLTLAVARSPHSLPIFVALSEGFFEAEGLNVKAIEAPSGRRCLKMMAEGLADLGTAAETAIAFESFDRTDFSVIATFSSTSNDVALIARHSSGIRTAGDLVGKRVGVAKGTSAHYFLDNYLLANSIDPKSLDEVVTQPEQSVDALIAGKIDALAVFQPFAYAAAHSASVQTVVLADSGGYTQTFNLVAQNTFLKTRRDDLERFLRAMQRANAFIRAQPRRAEAILVSRLGVLPAFASWSMQRTHQVLALDEGFARLMQAQAAWAQREGSAPARKIVDFRTMIDSAALRAVLPNAAGPTR